MEKREFGNLADVREFLEIGCSFKSVQELFGKSKHELNKDIEEMGFDSYMSFKYQTIDSEYQNGMSVEGIARKWGMRPASVKEILKKETNRKTIQKE